MADTANLALPLLDAAQAQKHVTMNEALARLDAIAPGRVLTAFGDTPPPAPADGEAHLVGDTALGAWAGQDRMIALFLNGGWAFATPWKGMRVTVDATGGSATFDGTGWVSDRIAAAPGGAATLAAIAEIDHVLSPGPTDTTAAFIPDKAIVLGVSARVIADITGATSWALGVSGAFDRYGSGFGVSTGAFADGVTGTPQAYYGGTALLLTASGGDFSGGTVRIAAHYLAISPPASGV